MIYKAHVVRLLTTGVNIKSYKQREKRTHYIRKNKDEDVNRVLNRINA